MKLESENKQEHKNLRIDFYKETGIHAVLDNVSYIVWLENKLVKNMAVTHCCAELPNKIIIELSDNEMQIVSTEELRQMEEEAIEFDGFKEWLVKGKAAVIR